MLDATAKGPNPPTLEQVELAYVQMILSRCGGDKREAARVLGISLKTVYNKLRRIEAIGPGRD